MARLRTKILSLLAVIAVLCAMVILITACTTTTETYTVTFMVDNQQYGNAVEVTDGAVTLPTAPTKDYYTFRNWYTTSTFDEGTEFKNEGISSDMTVYAYFVADQVNVYINNAYEGVQDLVNVVNGSYNPGENLEFDGWYTDADCQVKYVVGDAARTLYARSVARITFNNGYEDVYTTTVLPGEKVPNPATTLLDGDVTVETAEIIKWYMDDKVIKYADENGDDIDFNVFTADVNTTITVKWATPWTYKLNSATGNYYISAVNQDTGMASDKDGGLDYYTFRSVPAISVLDEAKVLVNDEWQTVTVEAIASAGVAFSQFSSLECIIINEGIKSIYNTFNEATNGSSIVKKIVLPSSLKVVDNSFRALNELEELTLPEGLEVIVGSFTGGADRNTPLAFDLEVPSTLKALSAVSDNFAFSNNPNFYKDDEGRYFYKDERGDVLVADFNVVNGMLEIPEGIVGIQAGAFTGQNYDYLVLPASWTFVNFNGVATDYPFYYSDTSTYIDGVLSRYPTPFVDEQYAPNYNTGMPTGGARAYAVVTLLGKTGGIIVRAASLNAELPDYAIVGITSSTKLYTFRDDYFDGAITYVGQVEVGQPLSVYIEFENDVTDVSGNTILALNSGESLTESAVREALGITSIGDSAKFVSVTQFGFDYEFGNAVTTNVYLDIVWSYNTEGDGIVYEVGQDGNVTITGFNFDTAFLLEDYNTYLVQIPSQIDGKTVTAIGAGAFKDNSDISHVVIPNTVKTIGAEAFRNCDNLISVKIAAGGLETIGEAAFQDAAFTTIALPVANLKSVGAYAFKSRNLTKFVAAEGEEDRQLYTIDGGRANIPFDGLEEGMFFIYSSYNLVQYVSTNIEKQNDPSDNSEIDISVYDVKLIAMTGAYKATNYLLGYSSRRSSISGAKDAIVRYEIMEGSVYYLDNVTGIEFVAVSKIHRNAFTDINAKVSTVTDGKSNTYYYHGSSTTVDDTWVNPEDLTSLNPEIFEEGWWEGVMYDDPDYDQIMEFMTVTPNLYASILYY